MPFRGRDTYLEEEGAKAGDGVDLFGDAVARPADLNRLAANLDAIQPSRADGLFLLLHGRAFGEVLLVALALGVGEVRALICVQRKTQATLNLSNVIPEVIRVLLEINCLERETAKTCKSQRQTERGKP